MFDKGETAGDCVDTNGTPISAAVRTTAKNAQARRMD
jgi:hypothetical protein